MTLGLVALGATPRKYTGQIKGKVGESVLFGDMQIASGTNIFVDDDGVVLAG